MDTYLPTVGRIVNLYKTYNGERLLLAAVIARVWSATTVNLTVFNPDGTTFPMTSVAMLAEGSDIQDDMWFWPQYQRPTTGAGSDKYAGTQARPI